MAKTACKCKEKECEECPEWIFTFADLVMLMMGFFVILWVLKPAPGKDGQPSQELPMDVLIAIREAFNYLPDPKSADPVDKEMLLRKLQQVNPLKGPGAGGQTNLQRQGAEGDQPDVITIRKGNQSIVGSRVLFAPGDAALDDEARKALDQIAMLIKGHRNVMMVSGHTSVDDFPEGTEADRKLDLSIRRSKAVADYLVSRGVEPDILRVKGASTFEPVVQRAYTLETRRMNRRVEVEATTVLVPELQDRLPPVLPAPSPDPDALGAAAVAAPTPPAHSAAH